MKNDFIISYSAEKIEDVLNVVSKNDPALMIFFYGAENNYKELEEKIKAVSIPFIGCMDSGRFITGEYLLDEKSIVGMSISKKVIEKLAIESIDMSSGRSADIIRNEGSEKFRKAAEKIGVDLTNPDMERDVAVNILFGLSPANPILEGQSMAGLMLQTAGGSSGGRTDFKETNVISSAGSGHVGVFALLHLSKNYKFLIDRISSFSKLETETLTVTKLAGPRHILEFNNRPAASVYCEELGIDASKLNADIFANYTLGIEPGDDERLITSIMMKDENTGLLTYNNVVDGTRFNLYKAKKQQQDRTKGLGKLKDKELIAFISFDCILCYLARNTLDEVDAIAGMYEQIFSNVPKIGFSTFSENICGANVNQTETYLAIYKK